MISSPSPGWRSAGPLLVILGVRRAGEPQAEALARQRERVVRAIAPRSSVIADTMRSPSANLKYFCAGSP